MPNEPSVVDYNIFFEEDELETRRVDYDVNKNGKPLLDKQKKQVDQFRYFLTTRRLIQFSMNADTVIHIDGTYKLVWEGFPVRIIGTPDADRHFHPFGSAFVSLKGKCFLVCLRRRSNAR